MKKLLFTTALAAGFLCSCSSDDAPVATSQQPSAAQEGLVPVELSVGSPVSVSKKGTGVVGGLSGANEWAGQTLYLLMMQRSNSNGDDGWGYSKWGYIPTSESNDYVAENAGATVTYTNFADLLVYAPASGASGAIDWSTSQSPAEPKYYPTKGIHDFFAYRIDDAYVGANNDPADPKPALQDDGTTSKYIEFVIDGSQDLMVGRADNDDKEVTTEFPKGFSQATARAGKIPTISMKHLLTRFTFEVSGAGNNTLEGLSVTKIAVASRTTGKMTVAYDLGALGAEPTDLIAFTEAEETSKLELKQRTGTANDKLQALTPIVLETQKVLDGEDHETEEVKKDGEGNVLWKSYKAGESLMVEAGLETYDIYVTVKQRFKPNTPVYEGEVEKKYTITIANASGQTEDETKALAGTSYNVKIKVYGLEEIKVEASLTPWVDGGDVEAAED